MSRSSHRRASNVDDELVVVLRLSGPYEMAVDENGMPGTAFRESVGTFNGACPDRLVHTPPSAFRHLPSGLTRYTHQAEVRFPKQPQRNGGRITAAAALTRDHAIVRPRVSVHPTGKAEVLI
jgi:hypothetical protein